MSKVQETSIRVDVLKHLVSQLEQAESDDLGIITWAAPILSFGDISKAKLATLGLNPSNREFLDLDGSELDGQYRRFQSLNSLQISRWSETQEEHFDLILDSCNNYFNGNPYDGWFRALDKLLIESGVSYYGLFSNACHLDLVPYATFSKWYELSSNQKQKLMDLGLDALCQILKSSDIEVLVLNGQSVVDSFQLFAECELSKKAISKWTLPRKSNSGVKGYSYTGQISKIAGSSLDRQITILGYNHNIQSSYGVTSSVRSEIQKWITRQTKGLFH